MNKKVLSPNLFIFKIYGICWHILEMVKAVYFYFLNFSRKCPLSFLSLHFLVSSSTRIKQNIRFEVEKKAVLYLLLGN